jgi:hypothetical protein
MRVGDPVSEPNVMSLKTAVIIATKGRPEEVSVLLETLDRQTVLPDVIVVSTCGPNDIEQILLTKNDYTSYSASLDCPLKETAPCR